jgi:hypothetical protein
VAINIYQSAQLAANNGEFKKAGVLMTFAQSSPLLAAMPTVNITGNSYAWSRSVALGTTATRNIGEAYTEDAGAVETRSIALKIMGGDLDVDRFIVQTHGAQVRSQFEQMKAAYMAQSIAYQIVKGRTSSDPKGFDGLQVRYGGGFSTDTVVDAGENAGQIIANTGGSDALSMKDLDVAIQATENPTHLLMSKKQRVNITSYLRGSSTAIQMVKDEFGRLVTTYNGLPILDADVLGTVSGLEQLGYNENNDSTTSIYVLSLSDMGLHMIQNGGIDVRDLGEQDSKPVFRTRVEWFCNFIDIHPRCVTRLYNVADLTAVA